MNQLFFRLTFGLLFFFGSFSFLTAQKPKDIRREADAYFDHQLYAKALDNYTMLQRSNPKDNDIKMRIGICSYFTNDLEQAQKYLSFFIDGENGTEPQACFYLGRCAHEQLQFKEAIRFYKLYLRLQSGLNETQRRGLVDDIKRCASGQLLVAKDKTTLVENLGDKVNGSGDDFAPVLSPNNDEKIYFSSARAGNVGGLRDPKGLKDEIFGSYAADIYSAKITGGEWASVTQLNTLLNTPRQDVILDFNAKGTVMFFFKGFNLQSGEILVDTFRQNSDDNLTYLPTFRSPLDAAGGDGYMQFFNDSTLLFSSRRAGGFGGNDLYITELRNGVWAEPKNLGPHINTPYDELSPFLAADGRTLYFSSNSTQSTGGFDIFRIKFDDMKQDWTAATNVGFPINSAGDDLFFRVAKDGQKAFYSSNRKDNGSFGGSDIYVAYFKTVQEEQLVVSEPLLFSQVAEYFATQQENNEENGTSVTTNVVSPEQSVENKATFYEFNSLYYNSEDDILGPVNVRQLNKISRLMNDFPQLKIQLTAHSDPSEKADYDLFFSMKRSEKISDYLIKNGVRASQILLKSCGSNYPIAKNIVDGNLYPAGQRMNRRLDIQIKNIGNLPLRISISAPEVSEFMAAAEGTRYRNVSKDLSYKVQVAAIKQMYKGELITKYSDAGIEKSADTPTYLYTLGLFKTLSSAEQLRKEIAQKENIKTAFIVAYIGGVRVSLEEAKQYQTVYSDLANYVTYLKNKK